MTKYLNHNILKVLLILFISGFDVFSQNFSINKIEPPNWWVGMEWDTLQLMIYGENLQGVSVRTSKDELKIVNFQSLENDSYLFIDMIVPNDLNPDTYYLIFSKDDYQTEIPYSIFKRKISSDVHLGFSNEDVIYLIMADRFCDGNSSNNNIGDSLDQFTSEDLNGRKGGDIEGIISKLDYLKELGITAIWITPMLENNMYMSYHGYAATNLYEIDPRFGTNELYKKLVEEAHDKGIKIIFDHVSNHIGINHPWVINPPTSDWFHGTPTNHLPVSHNKIAFIDIHGDSTAVKFNQEGWFSDYMPDLNQRNLFLKKYLIQNTLWWIEFSGLDGIREDTYPYADQKYLSEWAEVILSEYPNFNIVGEVWQGTPSVLSAYQTHSPIRKLKFDSNLPVVTDFALSDAIRSYLSGDESIYQVYLTLAQDNVYSDSDNLLVFFDNHDIQRAMLLANGDLNKFEIALNLILFTRGIPVLFYGTEIGIEGGPEHGELRQPFPGGFTGDERNAFLVSGRTENENDIYNYLNKLFRLRKDYPVLSKGKLTHIYRDNVYLLIKTLEKQTALIILNTRREDFSFSEFKSFLPEVNQLKDLETGEIFDLNNKYETIFLKGGTFSKIFLIMK